MTIQERELALPLFDGIRNDTIARAKEAAAVRAATIRMQQNAGEEKKGDD